MRFADFKPLIVVIALTAAVIGLIWSIGEATAPAPADVSPVYRPTSPTYPPNELAPRRTVVTITVTETLR